MTACAIIAPMWERRSGNTSKLLVFGLEASGVASALSAITDPQIRFRRRAMPASTAVVGLGELAAYTDTENDPALYNTSYRWHEDDPQTPGVYAVEITGTDDDGNAVTFPDTGEHWLIRIVEGV